MLEGFEGGVILLGIAALTYVVVRYALLPLTHRAASRTATRWDDILASRKLLNRLSWFAPLVVIRIGLDVLLNGDDLEGWLSLTQRVTDALLIITGLLSLSALSAAVDRIYMTLEVAKQRPIKGYLQISMIILWVIGGIVVVARLADQSIGLFIGGLGAISAVVLLVFRDTILSLVAAVQLTSDDMLRVGDWIEMPDQNANGAVIEVALHTVKVQNWDNTITTIPTYQLISDSFRNWRGMTESGGRRIMRSLMIDMSTIRFLEESEIDQWAQFEPLADYMRAKRDEISDWNRSNDDGDLIGDPRRLTNIGTFRAYVIAYLERHPRLATDTMTMMVRQLQPTPDGLPLEIYAFTDTTAWEEYEAIQADIFDHLLAIIDEFGLRVHQTPTGADITALRSPR